MVNNKTDNIYFGAVPSANIKGHNNFRDTSQLGLNLTADLKTDETQALDKRNADNIKSGANGRTDQRQDYNTWIPFLHKPHLVIADTHTQKPLLLEISHNFLSNCILIKAFKRH